MDQQDVDTLGGPEPKVKPSEPPALLPGRSALSYGRDYFRGISVGLIGLASIWIVAAIVPSGPRAVLVWVPAVAAMAGLIYVFVSLARARRAAVREAEAGYSTTPTPLLLPAGYRWYDLWEIDPTTGDVLRQPGERERHRRPRNAPPPPIA